jgi:hypothetical protein
VCTTLQLRLGQAFNTLPQQLKTMNRVDLFLNIKCLKQLPLVITKGSLSSGVTIKKVFFFVFLKQKNKWMVFIIMEGIKKTHDFF